MFLHAELKDDAIIVTQSKQDLEKNIRQKRALSTSSELLGYYYLYYPEQGVENSSEF